MTVDEYQRQLFEHADKLGYVRRDIAVPTRGPTAGVPEYLHFQHPASSAVALIVSSPPNPRYISSAKEKLQSELNRALGIKPQARKKQISLGKDAEFAVMEELPDIFWTRTLLRMVRCAAVAGSFPMGADFDTETLALLGGLKCVNCGEAVAHPSPYCSDFCKQLSGTVRYVRKSAGDGRLESADFKLGLGARLIALFKGGYPTRARFLTRQQHDTVFKRDNQTCQLCGNPADQIDHVNGDSSDPSNLRAVCGPCNRRLAMTNTREPSREETAEFLELAADMCAELATRIAAPRPCHSCDGHERWKRRQPQISAARRRLLKETEEEAEGDFEDIDGYLWHSMQKDD